MLYRLFEAGVINHARQRYPTTGDWKFREDESLRVDVSHMRNRNYEFLVAIHETIEAELCRAAGIKESDVSRFDEMYEAARPTNGLVDPRSDYDYRGAYGCDCSITETSEPGDDKHAPYYKQHQLATSVERMLAAELGVSWNDYEAANLALYETETK